MKNQSYISAIRSLMADKERLAGEIKVLDKAIEALSVLLDDEEKAFIEMKGADRGKALENKTEKRSQYDSYVIDIPELYNKDLAPIEMLIFAIYELKGATAIDAATYLSKKDDTYDYSYLLRRFTEIGSALGRAGILNFKKIGKRYKYFIPKDVVQRHEDNLLKF